MSVADGVLSSLPRSFRWQFQALPNALLVAGSIFDAFRSEGRRYIEKMKLDLAKASHSGAGGPGSGNTTPPPDAIAADSANATANTAFNSHVLVDAGVVTRTTGSRRGIATGIKRAASFHSALSPKAIGGGDAAASRYLL